MPFTNVVDDLYVSDTTSGERGIGHVVSQWDAIVVDGRDAVVTELGGIGGGLGCVPLQKVFSFGGGNFRGVLNGKWCDQFGCHWGDRCNCFGSCGRNCWSHFRSPGCGEGGQVSCLCGGDLRGILDLDGRYQVGDGSDGQVVREDTETAGIGGIRDADLFAFRVDVSVTSDLIAESIAVVGGGLSGVSIAETSLTQLILCVVLTGRYPKRKRSRKESADSVAVIVGKLRLCGHSQNQQAKCDLTKRNKKH